MATKNDDAAEPREATCEACGQEGVFCKTRGELERAIAAGVAWLMIHKKAGCVLCEACTSDEDQR